MLDLFIVFLSTLSLRRATEDIPELDTLADISIHALLAESDKGHVESMGRAPRISIHALLAESDSIGTLRTVSVRNFYPRSPCGERHPKTSSHPHNTIFLSTLSLRRATEIYMDGYKIVYISIHALLAESDRKADPIAE